MSTTTASDAAVVRPKDRLEVLFGELGELMGQRNAIDGRIVDIVAEMEHDRLWGITGCRSISALVAWKTGSSSRNAEKIAAIARRAEQFPLCMAGLRDGRLSIDQVGIIAEKAGEGSDAHYVGLAEAATVNQLNTALKLEPPLPPEPDPWRDTEPERDPQPQPEPRPSITKTHSDAHGTSWKITLSPLDAATFDAALQSHLDAAITAWKWRALCSPDCGPNRVRLERMNGIGEEISEVLTGVSGGNGPTGGGRAEVHRRGRARTRAQ